MCRFIAYKGTPILLDDLLFKPKNSLIKQSYEAKELEEPLNGDGFGLGWYQPNISKKPAVFVSMTPAWSNRNLMSMAPLIRSGCIFAHVRAASMGDISEANCHPFTYNEWIFMHNGGIDDFLHLKRRIRRDLSDEIYMWVKGQTDSEHFFALFLNKVLNRTNVTANEVADVMQEIVIYINQVKEEFGIKSTTYLNTCISNGEFLVATRYCSAKDEEAPSLYYSTGTKYVCEDGVCHMIHDPKNRAAMVVSEKLTDIAEDWRKVPNNNIVIIHADMTAQLQAIPD